MIARGHDMSAASATEKYRPRRGVNPLRNFTGSGRRRGPEAGFVRQFGQAYLSALGCRSLVWQDFDLAGYGIADLVWIAWSTPSGDSGSALSLETLRRRIARNQLTAFELKVRDWRRAFAQAIRYRYFADRAIVVLPPRIASRAAAFLDAFRRHGVGLWSFDPEAGEIRRLYTPTGRTAINPEARRKAVERLLRHLDLRKAAKHP